MWLEEADSGGRLLPEPGASHGNILGVLLTAWSWSPDTEWPWVLWEFPAPAPARSRPAQATFGPASNTAPEQDFFSDYLETCGRRQAKAQSPSTAPPSTVGEKGKEAGHRPHLPPQSFFAAPPFLLLQKPHQALGSHPRDPAGCAGKESWTLKRQG